jgi:hydrogenase-4 component B
MLTAVFAPFAAAFVSYFAGKKSEKFRDAFVPAFTAFELLFIALFLNGALSEVKTVRIEGFMTEFGIGFRLDGFRFIYTELAVFMWTMCSLASKRYFLHHENTNRYYFFWLVTLGATVGVFMSEDLITAFLFFEIMSFASYVFVAQEETEGALRAATTYLAIAVIGGLAALMGMFMLYRSAGSVNFEEIASALKNNMKAWDYTAGAMILIGFGAKAGVFPLHIWLPKAHPVAPAPASAVLSGMLTKAGVYGVIFVCCRLYAGNHTAGLVLTVLAMFTMVTGAVLALFSVDLKRTLACSSVSQIGFILTGISMTVLGPENTLASGGAFLHMVNHSLFKLILFLCAGIVMQNLHKLNLNEIRGFGRKKPFLMICFLMGAVGLGGIPGFSGYISKTMIHEAIVEESEHFVWLKAAEIIFLISGGITIAYMTKLFVALFVEKNVKDEEKMRASDGSYITPAGRIAIALPALAVPALGLFPHVFGDRLANAVFPFFTGEVLSVHRVDFFNFENLKGAGISLAVGVLLYFGVVRLLLMKEENGAKVYTDRWPAFIDIEDRIYRPFLALLSNILGTVFAFLSDILPRFVYNICNIFLSAVARAFGDGADMFTLLLRKTVFKENPTEKRYIGTRWTHRLGRLANAFERFLNVSVRRKHPKNVDHVITYAEDLELNRRKMHMFESSLSFGILMFCIGFCITMIYLLFR